MKKQLIIALLSVATAVLVLSSLSAQRGLQMITEEVYIDFGKVDIWESATRRFTIENPTASELEFRIKETGGDLRAFHLRQLSGTLAARRGKTIFIVFSPSFPGKRKVTFLVEVRTSLGWQSLVRGEITGEGVAKSSTRTPTPTLPPTMSTPPPTQTPRPITPMATPPPTPRPRTPTAAPRLTPTPRTLAPEVAHWNSWVVDDSDTTVELLRVQRDYTLRFDLAPLQYVEYSTEPIRSAAADARIGELVASQASKATVYVQPIAVGDGIEINDNGMIKKEIDLEKLRIMPAVDPDWNLSQLSQGVAAVQIKIPINTTAKGGCGGVALVIWDRRRERPLDHLVRWMTIATDNNTYSGCNFQDNRITYVETKLGSMLGIPKRKADAALYVFELPMQSRGVQRTVATFIRKEDTSPFTWKLDFQLTDFISDPNGLPKAIRKAHRTYDYSVISDKLKAALFSPNEPTDADVAENAFNALASLKRRGGERPVLVSKLIDSRGDSLFLPVGLLDSSGLLGSYAEIEQPLIRDQMPSKQPCVDSWTTVFPTNLGHTKYTRVLEEYRNDLVVGPIISSWQGFKNYLGARNVTAREGLILLSHHESGNLFFLPGGDYAAPGEMRRKFKEGSFAVLMACGTGGTSGAYKGPVWLDRMRKRGVSAAIFSVFDIKMEYGITFAAEFSRQLAEARKARQPTRLYDVFESTRSAVSTEMEEAMGYELIFAGDPELEVCGIAR